MKDNKNTDGGNVILGALFLIGAIALLLNKIGFLNILLVGMSFFDIIVTVFFVRYLVKGMAKRSFGQILFSVAFIIIANDKVLHMEAFTPWTVLGAAALGTIGLNLMFPNFRSGHGRFLTVNGREVTVAPLSAESRQGSRICFDNCFGQSVKYVSGEVSRVKFDNSFGFLQVYFTDAQLEDGTAEVITDVAFGSTILYVPADWKVIMNVSRAFGAAGERGQCNPEGNMVLYVKGDVAFGKIEIRYI